jgi:hypothetical protein
MIKIAVDKADRKATTRLKGEQVASLSGRVPLNAWEARARSW